MRQLYEQILVDHEKRRFYAKCETSGEKRYSVKLPLSCRGEELLQLLEEGCAGGLRQKKYNSAKARAVQDLARYFNQCRKCGKWVCDEMFDPDIMECKQCNITRV